LARQNDLRSRWHRWRVTEDKGVDKNGKPKDNFTPGYELRAKVTVLAEGPRGSLHQTTRPEKLNSTISSQIYSIGVKELLGCAARTPFSLATSAHARLARPTDMYGGGWIYGLANNPLSRSELMGRLRFESFRSQFDRRARSKTHLS